MLTTIFFFNIEHTKYILRFYYTKLVAVSKHKTNKWYHQTTFLLIDISVYTFIRKLVMSVLFYLLNPSSIIVTSVCHHIYLNTTTTTNSYLLLSKILTCTIFDEIKKCSNLTRKSNSGTCLSYFKFVSDFCLFNFLYKFSCLRFWSERILNWLNFGFYFFFFFCSKIECKYCNLGL